MPCPTARGVCVWVEGHGEWDMGAKREGVTVCVGPGPHALMNGGMG